MWLNVGKFLDNGRSGYILKPQYMREEKITYNPETKVPVVKTLIVTVISGWQLPKCEGKGKEGKQKGEIIDPYVKLVMRGVKYDDKDSKTKVVKNNGFNPVWKNEFKFPLTRPELALLMFLVKDSDVLSSDDLIAQFALPVDCIRNGYRCIPMKDSQGNVYEKASLLIHFKWTTP